MGDRVLVPVPLVGPGGTGWRFLGLAQNGELLDDKHGIITDLDTEFRTHAGTADWWNVMSDRRADLVASSSATDGVHPSRLQALKMYAADLNILVNALSSKGTIGHVTVITKSPSGLTSTTPFAWTDAAHEGGVVAGSTIMFELRLALGAIITQGILETQGILQGLEEESKRSTTPKAAIASMARAMDAVKRTTRLPIVATNTLEAPLLAENAFERPGFLDPEALVEIGDFLVAMRLFGDTMHKLCSPTAERMPLLLMMTLFNGTRTGSAWGDEGDPGTHGRVSGDTLQVLIPGAVKEVNRALTFLRRAVDATRLLDCVKDMVQHAVHTLCRFKAFASVVLDLACTVDHAPVMCGRIQQIQKDAGSFWTTVTATCLTTCQDYVDVMFEEARGASGDTLAWLEAFAVPGDAMSPGAQARISHIVRAKRKTISNDVYDDKRTGAKK
jgi:hypothetical protein